SGTVLSTSTRYAAFLRLSVRLCKPSSFHSHVATSGHQECSCQEHSCSRSLRRRSFLYAQRISYYEALVTGAREQWKNPCFVFLHTASIENLAALFLLPGVWICSFILRFRLSIRSAGAEISIAAGDFRGQLCAGQLDGFRLRVEPPVERLGGRAVLLMLADGDSWSVRAWDQNDCLGVADSRVSRAGGCLVGGRFVAMDLDLHFYSSGPIRGGYSTRYSTVRQGDQPALSLATRSFVGRIFGLGFGRVL